MTTRSSPADAAPTLDADRSRGLRVATLLPAATEIVCALGLESALVGVSHECDWPPGVRSKRALTSTRVVTSRDSGAIDRDVRRVLQDALAVYEIDVDALAEAAPDVIVTQDLCDVCAVSLDDVRAAAQAVLPRARIVNLRPMRLADIWTDVLEVGRALEREEAAHELVRSLCARVDSVRERASAAVRRGGRRPRVLSIEWIDPVMVGGTWMPELIEIAGGLGLVTRPGDHAPTLSRAQLAALDPAPDVVLVKPCGFDIDRVRAELDRVRVLGRDLANSCDWPAVREHRIWIADGNAYFNRPGPRIVESLEILAACVHPEEFRDCAARHAAAFELCATS
jgi:iron complex transport system substrate-binding protein